MNTRPIVQRHPALRWLAPVGVVGVIGAVALAASGTFAAKPTAGKLPVTSARSLLAAVQKPQLTGFSGTVVSRLTLGLPELPKLTGDAADDASLGTLLGGSHTLKVWYGGPTKQRVALLGATDETDIFRSGNQLWQWTSSDRLAVRTVLSDRTSSAAAAGTMSVPAGQAAPSTHMLTPAELTDRLLRDLDPSTIVTVSSNRRVAHRDAYQLVLTPRAEATTKIGSVRVSVDGRTKVALGVQVYARGMRTPAIDVAFTSISFVKPADTSFRFTPPAGADVRIHDLTAANDAAAKRATSTGAGWATIWTYCPGARAVRAVDSVFADAAVRVAGTWGTGRLVSTDLASVLVTDDGRVLVGAVEADALFAAAK